jgi:hypothetical protein
MTTDTTAPLIVCPACNHERYIDNPKEYRVGSALWCPKCDTRAECTDIRTTIEWIAGGIQRVARVHRVEQTILTVTVVDVDEPGTPRVSKTAAQWVASEGRGFLASTEY